MDVEHFAEVVGHGLDAAGVGVIAVGVAIAIVVFAVDWKRRASGVDAYRLLRRRLGRVILGGIEILVAADIVRTVAVEQTFKSVGVLGLIVLIRGFLSATLEMEISGEWPWQRQSGTPPT